MPSVLRRARKFLLVARMFAKAPQTSICPFACIAIFQTVLSALGLNPVSRAPELETRAIRFLVIPPILVKVPPSSIFPSGLRAIV